MKNKTNLLVIGGAVFWCSAILLAPALNLHAVYEFFSRICHQNPERSWFLGGEPLPVCIRCASIYFGFLAGAFLALPADNRPFKLAIAATVLEVILARTLLDSVWLRSLTGFGIGISAAPFVLMGVRELQQTWRRVRSGGDLRNAV